MAEPMKYEPNGSDPRILSSHVANMAYLSHLVELLPLVELPALGCAPFEMQF